MNTARGAIVDTDALVEAVSIGRLGGYSDCRAGRRDRGEARPQTPSA